MGARAPAGRVGRSLYRIELSPVVRKWIGETEKNLPKAFQVFEGGREILPLDEAEALVGNRNEVQDGHDRCASTKAACLFRRAGAHRGRTVLATNHETALDTGFQRSLQIAKNFRILNESGES